MRVAILDLYDGQANEGMRCLRQIIKDRSTLHGVESTCDEFNVRQHAHVPDLSYDIYISSGGPGSPLESEGSEWENAYFNWLHSVEEWNNNPEQPNKKFVFLICHSFQMVCRYFQIGEISKRKSTSFGVFPVHVTIDGQADPVFAGLKDPFYVVDSRDYQVTTNSVEAVIEAGARILCIEKYRPHVPYAQAIMAIRFNEYMIGTQFHPEADAVGMSMYLQKEEKKQIVIENHGYEKWKSMLVQLNDPEKIMWTYAHVLPNFFNEAVKQLKEEEVSFL